MCRARRGGPRTPSRTTDANLDCTFVENALVFVAPKTVINCNQSIRHENFLLTLPVSANQPMVTIRRVDNPAATQPTVTISMKSDIKKANKSNPEGTDKLLYTLVNGEILKAKDAPENLIPSAKPMPKGMQVIQNGGLANRGGGGQPPPIQPQPVGANRGGGGQAGQQQPAPTRPPLPLDGQVWPLTQFFLFPFL